MGTGGGGWICTGFGGGATPPGVPKTLSILAYIHKIYNVSTGLLTISPKFHTDFGGCCTGPGPRTWPMGP